MGNTEDNFLYLFTPLMPSCTGLPDQSIFSLNFMLLIEKSICGVMEHLYQLLKGCLFQIPAMEVIALGLLTISF
jgi:hypothetical protein